MTVGGGIGDLVQTIAGGIAGLVSGAIDAILAAGGTIVTTLQGLLPGPLLPIVAGVVALLILWSVFRR